MNLFWCGSDAIPGRIGANCSAKSERGFLMEPKKVAASNAGIALWCAKAAEDCAHSKTLREFAGYLFCGLAFLVGVQASLRDARPFVVSIHGLKPMATIRWSLRDQEYEQPLPGLN